MGLLDDQVAVVTGQGIGLAIAWAIVEAGGRVLIADLDPGTAQAALDRFGRLDLLVDDAGVTRDGYVAKLTDSDFDLVVDTSLKGAWLGTRAVTPVFREQRRGAIVNISSLSGGRGL